MLKPVNEFRDINRVMLEFLAGFNNSDCSKLYCDP